MVYIITDLIRSNYGLQLAYRVNIHQIGQQIALTYVYSPYSLGDKRSWGNGKRQSLSFVLHVWHNLFISYFSFYLKNLLKHYYFKIAKNVFLGV